MGAPPLDGGDYNSAGARPLDGSDYHSGGRPPARRPLGGGGPLGGGPSVGICCSCLAWTR